MLVQKSYSLEGEAPACDASHAPKMEQQDEKQKTFYRVNSRKVFSVSISLIKH